MNISPKAQKSINYGVAIIAGVLVLFGAYRGQASFTEVSKIKATLVVVALKGTITPTATPTISATPTLAPATSTPEAPTATATSEPSLTPLPTIPTPTPGATTEPYPDAPLCPDHDDLHDVSLFHTLWNSARGCHYDHEHGHSPFTSDVADVFAPLGDLQTLLGGVQIGHTNLSSPCENAIGACGPGPGKHGGFDWSVNVPVAHPGAVGFENNTVGICNLVSQFHNFGDYGIEFETRFHTALVAVDQCQLADMNDHGFVFTVQGMEYGQRTTPYQGTVLAYPDNFQPQYASGLGPYDTADCVGPVAQCRPNLAWFLGALNRNAASKWTSKPTGAGARPPTSSMLQILFDIRDIYRVFDWNDQEHPFTWLWICTSDGGATYNPAGCRFNNSTTSLHEVAGTVPLAWDQVPGFDTDDRVGRVTASGYTTRYGVLDTFCTQPSLGTLPGTDCWPFKLVNAFTGKWGADLCEVKCSLLTPANTPENDIYFCGEQVCQETDAGAVPSGWIGPNN